MKPAPSPVQCVLVLPSLPIFYSTGELTLTHSLAAGPPCMRPRRWETARWWSYCWRGEPTSKLSQRTAKLQSISCPDTSVPQGIDPGPLATAGSDGVSRYAQPMNSKIVLNKTVLGQTRALLRVSNLSVTEFHYLATAGIPMQVIAHAGRMLRDTAGNNLYYNTNSLEIGPGDNVDVILDATTLSPGTYFLYSPSLDHLSNDAENFGGMMTEIQVL